MGDFEIEMKFRINVGVIFNIGDVGLRLCGTPTIGSYNRGSLHEMRSGRSLRLARSSQVVLGRCSHNQVEVILAIAPRL